MQKCYNILFTGKVQDVGFRRLVENIANSYNLRGFVFNDIDDTVKVVCCCENGIIEDFLAEIRNKSLIRGSEIDYIGKEDIPFRLYLPQGFYRLQTDEQVDIGRKLDKGNEELENIGDILGSVDNRLNSIENTIKTEFGDVKVGINNLNNTLSTFVEEQREHNKHIDEHDKRMEEYILEQREHNNRMDEHNLRLEKILEKLAEK